MVKRIELLNSVSLLNVKTVTAPSLSPESYNVDIGETSVSGLSSGAYMAVQFHVSFSSIVKGAGITAGGKSRKKSFRVCVYFCDQVHSTAPRGSFLWL